MATEPTVVRRGAREREPSLRPARWPGRPRVVTLLRGALIATLLTLAAGLLYAQEPANCADRRADAGPAPEAAAPVPSAALPIPRGLVGVPVRLAEPAAASAAQRGGRVDLLAVPVPADRTTVGQPAVLASAALVLDVLTGGDAPPALVLALEPDQARRVVGQPETTRFAVLLR